VGKLTIRELSAGGLIAALYTILSLVFLPISFGVYQIRIAEALTILPFLTRAAIPGLYIGCLLANIFGGMGWLDIVFGPIITLAAAVLTHLVRRLSRSTISALLVGLLIFFMWAGALYFLTSFKMTMGTAVGTILSIVSLLLMTYTVFKQGDNTGSRASVLVLKLLAVIITAISIVLLITTGDIYFIVVGALLMIAAWLLVMLLVQSWFAVIIIVISIVLLITTSDIYFIVVGAFLMIAALLLVMLLAQFWFQGKNPNILIAPLPPVLLNAFGVSLYLAPLLGFNYWFSVQMVGVGQLIACYLIGLPVLMALRKRKVFENE